MPGPAPGSSHRPPAEAGDGQTCKRHARSGPTGASQHCGRESPQPSPLFGLCLSHLSDKYPNTTAPRIMPTKKQVDVILFSPLCSHTKSHCRQAREGPFVCMSPSTATPDPPLQATLTFQKMPHPCLATSASEREDCLSLAHHHCPGIPLSPLSLGRLHLHPHFLSG